MASSFDALSVLFPNVAITREISVRVAVSYLAEQSNPSLNRWFWSYHVRIENRSDRSVQLLSRSWNIVDARGAVHEVHGEMPDPQVYSGDIVIVDGSRIKEAQKKFFQSIPLLNIFRPF